MNHVTVFVQFLFGPENLSIRLFPDIRINSLCVTEAAL